MSRERLLVIDADLPRRLAPHLEQRNRQAIHVYSLGLAYNIKDPQLLRALADHYNGIREWVLVTGDDSMPAEHGPVILETEATIAVIHPVYPPGMTEHSWHHDMAQRWAHSMQEQPPYTVRRYALAGSQPWKPRRRHISNIARYGWTPWRPDDAKRAAEARQGEAVPERRQDRIPGVSWGASEGHR